MCFRQVRLVTGTREAVDTAKGPGIIGTPEVYAWPSWELGCLNSNHGPGVNGTPEVYAWPSWELGCLSSTRGSGGHVDTGSVTSASVTSAKLLPLYKLRPHL